MDQAPEASTPGKTARPYPAVMSAATPPRTRLAFSIIAHRSPAQVVALARIVAAGGNYCVIHCNVRSGPDFRRAIELGVAAAGLDTVRFLDSEPVAWGNHSILRVQLRCISVLVDWADDWTHLVNLSGQCLPTQPMSRIADDLANYRGRSFLETMDFAKERPQLLYRYTRIHLPLAGRLRNTRLPRPLPRDFDLYFGSFWGILAREACCHIARSPEAGRILRALRYACFPDELAFQSILANSHLRDSILPQPRRLTFYDGGGAHPIVLGMAHRDALADPEFLFARKFDPGIDARIIDHVTAQNPSTSSESRLSYAV